MLVLTRRVGEEIVIDDLIYISVTAISGNKVRIGVTAPKSVRVVREEIRELRAGQDECDLGGEA
jgi:carbon storage regulator